MDKPQELEKPRKKLKARPGATLDDLDDGLPSNYVPVKRTVDEIFEDDAGENIPGYYADVIHRDKEIFVSRNGQLIEQACYIGNWEDAHLHEQLLANIKRSNWLYPRKIQAVVVPLILTQDCDLKGQAETGTGKTATFMIPLVQKIIDSGQCGERTFSNRKPTPVVIVIEPTRELAVQVFEQGKKLAHGTGVSVGVTYGRTSFIQAMRDLERYGCDILVTTVGRLKHLLEHNLIDFSRFRYFVFDEADRLLLHENFYPPRLRVIEGELTIPLDFLDDMKEILPMLPPKSERRNFIFSATFPDAIDELATLALNDNSLLVSNPELVSVNRLVKQEFFDANMVNKMSLLVDVLTRNFDEADAAAQALHDQGIEDAAVNPKQVLVFVKKKRDCDRIAAYLCANNIKATSINGDRKQVLREKSLRDFHNCEEMVLVGTDVMARGIDVKELDHIINYDMPPDKSTYVHRIGRTGRLKPGLATSFFAKSTMEDMAIAPGLVELLKADGLEVPDYVAAAAESHEKREDIKDRARKNAEEREKMIAKLKAGQLTQEATPSVPDQGISAIVSAHPSPPRPPTRAMIQVPLVQQNAGRQVWTGIAVSYRQQQKESEEWKTPKSNQESDDMMRSASKPNGIDDGIVENGLEGALLVF